MPSTIRSVALFAVVAQLARVAQAAAASEGARPKVAEGRYISQLQLAYLTGKSDVGGVGEPEPPCDAKCQEEARKSLMRRVMYLEKTAAKQAAKLAELRAELTGEEGTEGLIAGAYASGQPVTEAHVEALERALGVRASTAADLLRSTRKAIERKTAELAEGSQCQDQAPCTC
mmetsp:Transcript_58028/g.149360  ORF Transcript_58028/g.149360 Transcript_58028/m.149360 type:complete len:173 (+) Transcript_58028:108-626(+)